MENYILIGIIVVCTLIIVISFISHRKDLIINFLFRIVFGIAGIYFMNSILGFTPFTGLVGINELTVLTVGVLGFPGFLLLYGTAFYFGMMPLG